MLVLCKIVNHWIMSMSHGRGEIKRNCNTRMLYNTNTVLQNCVLKNKKVRRMKRDGLKYRLYIVHCSACEQIQCMKLPTLA